ncbi:MAG: adenylate/guanylate cyclase domain-containing protein [Parvularcula sp.]
MAVLLERFSLSWAIYNEPLIQLHRPSLILFVEASVSLGALFVLALVALAHLPAVMRLGVDNAMHPTKVRYIRFTNAVGFSIAVANLFFLFAEAPVIVDWGDFDVEKYGLLMARTIASLMFLLVPVLSSLGRLTAARLVLMVSGLGFCIFETWLYGKVAPTDLYLISIIVIAAAIFPPTEQRFLIATVVSTAVALIVCMLLRELTLPAVPVQRPAVQAAINLVVTVGAFFVILAVTVSQRTTTQEAETRVLEEQARSERLLHNILPVSIAKRLKASPGLIADGHEEASVLFVDLVGFTPLARNLPPADLVNLLDRIFREIDDLVDLYGLEKIKTIGDSYMVAGGVPDSDPTQKTKIAQLALDVRNLMASNFASADYDLNVRIGIASGPVVAGIIGSKKFSYDLWGDTVNLASRLESHGVPGRIQVDDRFRAGLTGRFHFEERGVIEVKGLGKTKVYFLEGTKR